MKWQKIVIAAVMVLSATMAGWSTLCASEEDDAVQKAFALRMDGKADEAKALLEETLSANPQNAAVLFEKARTNLHIGLSRPREFTESFQKSIKEPIEKAASLDPKNSQYALFAADMAFMNAYMSMKGQGSEIKQNVAKMCSAYENALKVDPDELRPMLCLVEVYGVLPENMGGDKAKAEAYAEKIEKKDAVFGAKARSLLLDDEANRIDYWRKVLEKHEHNADVLEELGKACLYGEEFDEGAKYLEKAIEANREKEFLLLDLGRFHLYRVMRDDSVKESALPAAEEALKRYLETDPIAPLKAYSYELLAKVKFGWGEKEAIEEMRKKANEIDPFHSMASGLPSLDLFVAPGEAYCGHRYLFRPL